MQLFLHPGGEEMAEQGYLIGLMSVLDAVLEVELSVIVAEFSLDSSLSSALLNYQGLLGGALKLTLAIEKNDWQDAEMILKAIRPATKTKYLYDFALESRDYADDVFSVVKS